MIYRRIISVLSLIAGLVALYLHLWKLGKTGALACSAGPHGCEFVQESVYGTFLGLNVALIGALGYAMIFIVSTIGSLEENADKRWPTQALMVLIWPAIAFTAYLKYNEFFVLHGFCYWCLESAVTIVACAVLVTMDWRRLKNGVVAR